MVSLKTKNDLRKNCLEFNFIICNKFLKQQSSSCSLLGGECGGRKGKEWQNGLERGDLP